MARPKHPVTVKIEAAIELLERNDMEITPSSVKVNAEKEITWADWSPQEAAREALGLRIIRVLRDSGRIISDSASRIRKGFWEATADELEQQLQIKQESSHHDRRRIDADKAVLAFLREKEAEFGYEVYPGLFHSEIDRIYSMHGISPPKDGVAA